MLGDMYPVVYFCPFSREGDLITYFYPLLLRNNHVLNTILYNWDEEIKDEVIGIK